MHTYFWVSLQQQSHTLSALNWKNPIKTYPTALTPPIQFRRSQQHCQDHLASAIPWSIFLSRRREPHGELHTQTPKLSLRLLPAITMDNEEDDDGNFTKWMSSYWGHGVGEDHAKARKRSFTRHSCIRNDRRASLPCMVR